VAFSNDYRRYGAAFVSVVSTAVLVWFGTGLNPCWPLLWFAPLPVLFFASCSSWQSAAATAALAWFIGGLNLWHYLSAVHTPPLARIAIIAIPALVLAAAVSLFRALLRRGAWWNALLAFPGTWVSFEYLFNLSSPHGTAGSLSYSQLNFLPFLQLASITGPWGMSFLLLLFPAILAIGLHLRHKSPMQALRMERSKP
jgi:apolipoprotein N-acyltransferase